MLNEEIKITKITSGISKDKTKVWTTFKYKYINPKLRQDEHTYTYWTDITKVVQRERVNEETTCQGCNYPKNECICFIDNLSND